MRVTSFAEGTNQKSKQREATLIPQSNERIVRHKLGLLNLAEELSNISNACKIIGLSRDTFYPCKAAVDEAGVEALIDKNRRKSNVRNRVDEITEETVAAQATEQPAHVLRYAQGMNFENVGFSFLQAVSLILGISQPE